MNSTILYCGFCGKSQHDVHKLIAGVGAFICNECVQLCAQIVLADQEAGSGTVYVSREAPLDSEAIIKRIVRELREEEAQGMSTEGENSRSEVEGEACQPGPKDAPNPTRSHP